MAAALCLAPALAAAAPPSDGSTKTQTAWDPVRGHRIAPDLHVGSSLRMRYELRDDFGFDPATAATRDFLLTRVRMWAHWKATEWLTFRVEAQDARVLRAVTEESIDDEAIPNIFSDSFDLHTAYAVVGDLNSKVPLQVKVGRQKLNLGSKRLVASLEWVNTARVMDAARVMYRPSDGRDIDLWASRLVPVRPNAFNTWESTGNRMFDSGFFGARYADRASIDDLRFEAYSMFRWNPAVNDAIVSFGGAGTYTFGKFDVDAEVVGQTGTWGGTPHLAAAVHAGGTYRLDVLEGAALGTAYNFGTGDGDADDNRHGTFDNLYPLNHAYYGYMDFVSWQNVHNAELTASIKPTGAFALRAAWQGVWLAKEDTDAWYNAGGGAIRTATGDVNPYAGSEVDLTVNVPLLKGRIQIAGGYSHWFAGAYVGDTGGSTDADWLWTQTTFRI